MEKRCRVAFAGNQFGTPKRNVPKRRSTAERSENQIGTIWGRRSHFAHRSCMSTAVVQRCNDERTYFDLSILFFDHVTRGLLPHEE